MTRAAHGTDLNRALIVNYHYCQPPGNGVLSGMAGVRPDALTRQLKALKADTCPMRLVEVAGMGSRRAHSPDMASLITFDDGTKDVIDHALPLLREAGVPAVIFCCSQPLLEKRVLDVQKIHLLQSRLGFTGFRAKFMAVLESWGLSGEREDSSRLGLAPMYRYDDPDARQFKFLLNVELPYRHLTRILDMLFEEQYGDQAEIARHLYMSLDDLKRCRDWGFEIGLHTHSHRMLSRLSADEQRHEIQTPLDFFRDELGLDGPSMSYPYGIRGSWNDVTKKLLADCDVRVAFTLGRDIYDPVLHADLLEVPRFDVNDVFDKEDRLQVDAAHK
jgi:peptidoglycan/xylan/chitin deacetylase (PgdA/CDA1 family)